jgi:peroxiredoxin family protein
MTDTAHHLDAVPETPPQRKRLALVASKGTLDQAYPALILATTAASMGWEAGIYFTFHGLDIIHQERHDELKVAAVGNPAGPVQVPTLLGALPGGTALATRTMRKWMDRSSMPDIAEFLEMARGLGVEFFACATTMGVMGVGEEDLVPGCHIAGAAAFLDYAADADVQLFT